MHIDRNVSPEIVFGCNRGIGKGNSDYDEDTRIWWMPLDASGNLYETRNWIVTRPKNFWDEHSYVVAMKPNLVNGGEIHFIYSDNSQELAYVIADMNDPTEKYRAIQLYTD